MGGNIRSNSQAEISAKLRSVFVRVFSLPSNVSDEQLKALCLGKHPWDSLKHIVFLNEIESEFSVSLDIKECLAMKTWESTLQLLPSLLVKK